MRYMRETEEKRLRERHCGYKVENTETYRRRDRERGRAVVMYSLHTFIK